ncbi:DUF819 family protein [Acetomicrobium sp.]|jgi:uncharacterized membrane protein|uniref:DUF819 family protein n=1 Tax=Acetomicrobium sp. TaxID=1872099 RepID=UPI001BCF141E|nr:DUF819 family protein [Acetomicrobium sp.]
MESVNVLIQHDAVLIGVLFFLPGVAFWLTRKYKWARYISAPGFCYLFGILLSNLHIAPPEHKSYDLISTYAVYMALAMVLFSVNIKSWLKLAKNAIIGMLTASILVAIVVIISGIIFALKVDPEHGWKLAGMIVGTYTGGSMNLVAVGNALETPSELFVATNATDIIFGSIFLPIQLALIPLFERMKVNKLSHEEVLGLGQSKEEIEKVKKEGYWHKKSWNFYDFTYIVSLAGLVMAASYSLSHAFNFGMWQGSVNLLLLTTFSLIAASTRPVSNLVGKEEIGMYLLHVFFVAAGATAYIPNLLKSSPYIIIWIIIAIYVTAFIYYFVSMKIFKIDYQTVLVTAQAAVGGPSSAMALPIAAQWPALAVTGIVCGLIGYAIGNYLGVGVAYLVFKIIS